MFSINSHIGHSGLHTNHIAVIATVFANIKLNMGLFWDIKYRLTGCLLLNLLGFGQINVMICELWEIFFLKT